MREDVLEILTEIRGDIDFEKENLLMITFWHHWI